MTCIVGLVDKGKVYIGADSATCGGWEVREVIMPKVFHHGDFLIGCAGSWRANQLLQYHLEVRPQGKELDEAYMVVVFAEAVRELLKEHGLSKVDNNVETAEDSALLVGYHGCLYKVQSDFSVLKSADGLAACGVGRPYALGAAWIFQPSSPKERVLKALEAAEYFSMGVRSPFVILEG